MKLHTTFITYNRLELTKQAIISYLETVTVPFTFVVVDNGSEDGTLEWLRAETNAPVLSLPVNYYPGYACNRGWDLAPFDADFLQRADNDFRFCAGWCDLVQQAFEQPEIGQVGLRTGEAEAFHPLNVGGNCIIRRTLWDEGLRFDERPWGREYPPGYAECAGFSADVREMGYEWTRVASHVIDDLASGDMNDPYYQASYGIRRIRP